MNNPGSSNFGDMKFDEAYWSGKYKQQLMGWDTGSITPPLKKYIDQIKTKELKILVPGCGNGHEVKHLHDNGFTNVTVVDISEEPFKGLIPGCPNWRREHFIVGDFFDHKARYDLIIEQTFFCSLDPQYRRTYAQKMHELLAPNGKLVGVLFNTSFEGNYPPFGGDKEEYAGYFKDSFSFRVFDECYNSVKPRTGTELFINLVKNDVVKAAV